MRIKTNPLAKLTAKCAYCGKTTTARLVDSAGVHVPVCVPCQRVDPTPPAHDPTYAPEWRVVRRGAYGPNPFRAIGIDIPALACLAGVSRQAMHKRFTKAMKNGLDANALRSLRDNIRIAHGLLPID